MAGLAGRLGNSGLGCKTDLDSIGGVGWSYTDRHSGVERFLLFKMAGLG